MSSEGLVHPSSMVLFAWSAFLFISYLGADTRRRWKERRALATVTRGLPYARHYLSRVTGLCAPLLKLSLSLYHSPSSHPHRTLTVSLPLSLSFFVSLSRYTTFPSLFHVHLSFPLSDSTLSILLKSNSTREILICPFSSTLLFQPTHLTCFCFFNKKRSLLHLTTQAHPHFI